MDDQLDRTFSDFVAANQRSLHRTAYLLVGSREGAEDTVQTALTAVYLAWARNATWDDPIAYARRAVVNAFLTSSKRHWWREAATERLPEPEPAMSQHAAVADRDELRIALATLAPRQRTAVVLRFYLDLTEADAAKAMNCPVGTVKSLTSRGLSSLRSTLTEVAS